MVTLVEVPDADHMKIDGLKPAVQVDHTENFPVITGKLPAHHIQCRLRI